MLPSPYCVPDKCVTSAGTVNPRAVAGGQRNPDYWGDRRNLFYDTLEKDPARRWKVYTHCMVPDLVRKTFPLTPSGIIKHLDLRRPIYQKTASGGHFGRSEPEFTWERTDKAEALRQASGALATA